MVKKKGQTLRINLRKEPISLDPRKGNDMVASQLHFMLFEGLLRLNADMSLSPAQAKSYEISPDGLIYLFHLDASKWSDGKPVTASDFEKSWKSLLDPKFPCPDAYLLYSIKNAKEAKRGEVGVDQVAIQALDEKTLKVELNAPSPHFLQIVASSVLLPIQPALEEKNPEWASSARHFISNGPFRLKEWRVNEEMVFEKNPHYLRAKEVKLEQVSVEIIDREMAVLHMYASGHFDLIGAPLSFFPAMIQEDLEKKKLLTYFPVAMTKFIAFNAGHPHFQNPHIRKAFALSIDRRMLIEHITKLKEREALNFIPPSLFGGAEEVLFKDADLEGAKASLEQGLEELGIKRGDLHPNFMYVSSEMNHLLGQQLQNQWQKVLGVPVTLEGVEFKTLHDRSERGTFSMGLFAWVAEYGDPMNILERFQDKTSHRNYAKWENPRYNAILDEMTRISSPELYLEKVKEAERIMADEMPITGLFHSNYVFLIHPHVKGFQISPLGHIYFDQISIE